MRMKDIIIEVLLTIVSIGGLVIMFLHARYLDKYYNGKRKHRYEEADDS